MNRNLLALTALSLAAGASHAYELPNLEGAEAQAALALFKADRQLANTLSFQPPAPTPFDCAASEDEMATVAGIPQLSEKLRGEIEKKTRKAMREQGMDPNTTQTSYRDLVIVPMGGHCADGKITNVGAEAKTFASYVSETRVNVKQVIAGKVVDATMVNTSQAARYSHQTIKAGGMEASAIMKMVNSSRQMYADPELQKNSDEMNEKIGGFGTTKPLTTLMFLYNMGRTTVTFAEMDQPKVTGGLFGVNVETVKALNTTVNTPLDEHHMMMRNYQNDGLMSESYMKDGVPHGPSVMYMDNYLKKAGMKLADQLGMEDTKEVTINGRDMLVKTTCMQNGALVKATTCPKD